MTSEKAYYKRLSEISGRRMEIHELADEKRQLSDETSMLRDMKLKLCRMENDVVFEKTRVKALGITTIT
jgi:FtsZ-binding cell division protein ZapB